jgi:beta-glucosidase
VRLAQDGLVQRRVYLSATYISDFTIVPWGFRKLLGYIHQRYTGPLGLDIIITENGFCVKGEHEKSRPDVINDVDRQEYYASYLKEGVEAAVRDGIPVTGYFAWSLAE